MLLLSDGHRSMTINWMHMPPATLSLGVSWPAAESFGAACFDISYHFHMCLTLCCCSVNSEAGHQQAGRLFAELGQQSLLRNTKDYHKCDCHKC